MEGWLYQKWRQSSCENLVGRDESRIVSKLSSRAKRGICIVLANCRSLASLGMTAFLNWKLRTNYCLHHGLLGMKGRLRQLGGRMVAGLKRKRIGLLGVGRDYPVSTCVFGLVECFVGELDQ